MKQKELTKTFVTISKLFIQIISALQGLRSHSNQRIVCAAHFSRSIHRFCCQLTTYYVTLDMKGCICHFVKWQIHPFMSKGTKMYVIVLAVSCDVKYTRIRCLQLLYHQEYM